MRKTTLDIIRQVVQTIPKSMVKRQIKVNKCLLILLLPWITRTRKTLRHFLEPTGIAMAVQVIGTVSFQRQVANVLGECRGRCKSFSSCYSASEKNDYRCSTLLSCCIYRLLGNEQKHFNLKIDDYQSPVHERENVPSLITTNAREFVGLIV